MVSASSQAAAASRVVATETGTGDLELWTLQAEDVRLPELDPSVLDEHERRRSQALVRASDQVEYVAGHILLRELLSRRLGVAPAAVAYRRERCPSCGGPNGRPALAGPGRSLHFSISRSAGRVLIGIASVPVGVDIEAVAQDEFAREVSALLHADERSEILAAGQSERAELFARLWTRKEAYLKGVGTGVGHGLAAQYVGGAPSGAAPPDWQIIDVPVAPGYAAAVAIQRRS